MDGSLGSGIGSAFGASVMFDDSPIDIGRDTGIQRVISALDDIGDSHEMYYVE